MTIINVNQVAKISNPKFDGPTTSSTRLTRAKNSDTNTMQDVLSKDNLPPNSTKSSDKEQAIDLVSNTKSSVAVQGSHSTEVTKNFYLLN